MPTKRERSQPNVAGVSLLCRKDFDMSRHPPNVCPVQAQHFCGSQSRQAADCDHCLQFTFRSFEQRSEFFWRVKLNLGGIRVFRSQRVRFEQSMRHPQKKWCA